MSDQTGSWQPDPFGRHQYRFWNGTEWTDQVSNDGVVSTDPPTPGEAAAAPAADPTVAMPTTPPAAASNIGQAYQQAAAAPQKAGQNKTMMYVIIAAVVALIGGGLFFVLNKDDNKAGPGQYGSDSALDALWDKCEAGDMEACDSLYFQSDFGTEYEEFGDTCGNRQEAGGFCMLMGDDDDDSNVPDDDDGDSNANAGEYGSDADLDAMWDACEAGDMGACDDLYFSSRPNSEYEEFGDTCGGRQAPNGMLCTNLDSDGDSGSSAFESGDTYGDNPVLDALWDACAAGDMEACDDLYFESDFGTEYERFADTCGDRTSGGTYCAD